MRTSVYSQSRWAWLGLVLLVLFVLGGLAACSKASAGQGATSASVTLYDNHLTSSQSTFIPGMPYHFIVVNKGAVDHELMLMPQVMGNGMAMMPMDQLDHLALARTGNLAPGATKSFDYTFTSSMAGHQGEFGCFYPGHYESGMHLPIAVSD